MSIFNPMLLCDFYKVGHYDMYHPKMTKLYSNLTCRNDSYASFLKESKHYDGKVVFFGLQHAIVNLMDQFDKMFFNDDEYPDGAIIDYERRVNSSLGEGVVDTSHIQALYDLGYLPIEIKAIPEGSRVNIGVPLVTITNTLPEFAWLVNYLETFFLSSLWKPITVATVACEYRKVLNHFANLTGVDRSVVDFLGHDFSMRGQNGIEDAAISGTAFLTCFKGTDTIPALDLIDYSYRDLKKFELSDTFGFSVRASEHSVMTSLIMYNKQLLDESGFDGDSLEEAEYITYRDLLAKFPNGIMALVSDQFDYWAVISKHLPRLKNEIMQRDGKLVIRPDSADPVEMICGLEIKDYTNNKYVESLDEVEDDFAEYLQEQIKITTEFAQLGPSEVAGIFKYDNKYYKMEISIEWNRLDKQFYFIDEDPEIDSCEEIQLTPEQKGSIECLWDTFGGTYNEKGFKVLDSHIGLIYGDAITIPRLIQICERLKAKGFAISNVVFGVGAYSLNGSLTRDTFGQAFKATYCEIDGKAVNVYKEPKTDKGKSSAKGLLCVNYDEDTKNYSVQNECTWDQEEKSCLKTVFKDGKLLIKEDFKVIRDRLGFIKEGK